MSTVREYYRGRAGRTAGSGSALRARSGWIRARLNQSSAVGWSGSNGGQGTGPNVRSVVGTGGGDGSGLLVAAALGDRAQGPHTVAEAEAGHCNGGSGQGTWARALVTTREAWRGGGKK